MAVIELDDETRLCIRAALTSLVINMYDLLTAAVE